MVTMASEALGIAVLPLRTLMTLAPPALVRDAPENTEDRHFSKFSFFCLKVQENKKSYARGYTRKAAGSEEPESNDSEAAGASAVRRDTSSGLHPVKLTLAIGAVGACAVSS